MVASNPATRPPCASSAMPSTLRASSGSICNDAASTCGTGRDPVDRPLRVRLVIQKLGDGDGAFPGQDDAVVVAAPVGRQGDQADASQPQLDGAALLSGSLV